jgi:hypothetical protein
MEGRRGVEERAEFDSWMVDLIETLFRGKVALGMVWGEMETLSKREGRH